jgi:hypothetical protein
MQSLNRFSSKIIIGLAGVVLIALAVIVLIPSSAPAQPVISWVPESVIETVLAGETKTVSVSFTASQELGAVEVWVVPELEPFVRTEPTSFTNIPAGQTTTLDITIAALADALPSTIEGTIQIRNAGRPPRNFARPLPVTVTVFTGAPFSTDPDPDKIINDEGAIYPVNEIVITLPDGVSLDVALEIANSVGGVISGFAPSSNLYKIRVPTNNKEELTNLIETLRNDSRIENVLRNYLPELSIVDNDLTRLGLVDFDLIHAYENISLIDA